MKNDFTKCFSCIYRKTNGVCERTGCGYTPIKSTNASEITQVSLIIPCPVSNEIKQNILEVKEDE